MSFTDLVGVEHLYLYNNASSDHPETVLQPYIDEGVAQVFFTDMVACQNACYFNALAAFRGRSRWMAFIDIDEYLFCPNGQDVRACLQEYEAFPALGAGWVIFASSGHQRKPEGLTIESYLRCGERRFEAHRLIKSIVNPLQAFCPANTPHSFVLLSGPPAVDENRVPTDGPYRAQNSEWTINRIRLNHYFTRSREEWSNQKRPRGVALYDPDSPDFIRPDEDFFKHDRNEIEDTTILRFLPELKRRLQIT